MLNYIKLDSREVRRLCQAILVFELFAYSAMCLIFYFKLEGGDILLRVAEGKYFAAGINPFDVYMGTSPIIESYGQPNAYSFISYFYIQPFTLFSEEFYQKFFHFLVDLFSLVMSVFLLGRMLRAPAWVVVASTLPLLASVFFMQAMWSWNYFIVSGFAVVLTFYGVAERSIFLAVCGMVLAGLKLSLALPMFIVLLFSGQIIIFLTSGIIYTVLLLLAAYQVHENPLMLLVQIKATQSMFSNGWTDGIFFFLKYMFQISLTELGVLSCIIICFLMRERLRSPLAGLILSIALSISFFYNPVSCLFLVFIILFVSLAMKEWLSSIILVLIFTVPRLVSLIPAQYTDYYIIFNNGLRCGALLAVTIYLSRRLGATYASRDPCQFRP